MDPEKSTSVIIYKESSFTKPKFLGVPRDDQLLEDSSREGIFGGRTISEVHAKDTAALAAAGYSWEQATRVLGHLAVAAEYSTLNPKYDDSTVISRYSNPRELIGFNGLEARRTRSRFQFDNPIRDNGIQGDPQNPIEAKVRFSAECQVAVGDNVTFVVNPQTFHLAEAHHLLEKGNRYALTGEQLVKVMQDFDQDAFDSNEQLQAWINEENKAIYGPYKAIPGHEEKIKFIDDSEVELQVRRNGSIGLKTNNDNLSSIQFQTNDESFELQDMNVIGHSYNIYCTKEGEEWIINYLEKTSNPGLTRIPIIEGSPLWQIAEIGNRLIEKAKNQPDALLSNEDASHLKDLMNVDLLPSSK